MPPVTGVIVNTVEFSGCKGSRAKRNSSALFKLSASGLSAGSDSDTGKFVYVAIHSAKFMESLSKTSCGRTDADASRELNVYTVSETGLAMSKSKLNSPSPVDSAITVELMSTRSTPLVDIGQVAMI